MIITLQDFRSEEEKHTKTKKEMHIIIWNRDVRVLDPLTSRFINCVFYVALVWGVS
jgi:hypothetical protein